jgi:hypothetical protein
LGKSCAFAGQMDASAIAASAANILIFMKRFLEFFSRVQ